MFERLILNKYTFIAAITLILIGGGYAGYKHQLKKAGEAARQAINSPVQSFASDMCLLALVLLYREFKRRGLKSRLVGTVHDALNLVVPEEEVSVVVPLVREIMENLPLERMFGVHLDVPIIADVKLGRYWGDALELPSEISANSAKVLQFIHEHQEELGI